MSTINQSNKPSIKSSLKASLPHKPTIWTRADALKVNENDPTTTQPLVRSDFPIMSDEYFIWDTMPLRDMDGNIASVNGWSVIFTLTAKRNKTDPAFQDENGNYDLTRDWEERHRRAKIYYWFSRTGKDWILGGRVMEPSVSPTVREWAGTAILLNERGEVDLYYTAVAYESMTPNATIAKVRGRVETTEDGVELVGFKKVKMLFDADGKMYQTQKQNSFWAFRDPCPFRDPKSGQLYMLFEGNVGGERGSHAVGKEEIGDVPPGYEDVGGSRFQAGCVGIAICRDEDGDDWEMLPPLLTAVGVNDQTERPHFVFQDEKYYLFTISHKYTYGDGLTGPDGVYGFVSDDLFGPYVPLNGSGLVLGNPPSQPYQTYSHFVMPNGLVTSFIDSVPMGDEAFRIGGTEAPTVEIKLKGAQTFVVGEYDYGYIPPMIDVTVE